tara:strand:- start:451 stop:558 length:108 start_codon:yes stop_codon:yes gene_type:complete
LGGTEEEETSFEELPFENFNELTTLNKSILLMEGL